MYYGNHPSQQPDPALLPGTLNDDPPHLAPECRWCGGTRFMSTGFLRCLSCDLQPARRGASS